MRYGQAICAITLYHLKANGDKEKIFPAVKVGGNDPTWITERKTSRPLEFSDPKFAEKESRSRYPQAREVKHVYM